MTRTEALCFHSANALVAGTGLIYAWMAYGSASDDPYAIVNHPLQSTLQHLHVLAAPLLVFMGGVVWRPHALDQARSGMPRRRASGMALIGLLVPMAASGYALQTASDESWRRVWVGVHLAASAAWIVGSLAHLLARRPPAQADESGVAQPSAADSSGATRG